MEAVVVFFIVIGIIWHVVDQNQQQNGENKPQRMKWQTQPQQQ